MSSWVSAGILLASVSDLVSRVGELMAVVLLLSPVLFLISNLIPHMICQLQKHWIKITKHNELKELIFSKSFRITAMST
jgi:hypothetical protein